VVQLYIGDAYVSDRAKTDVVVRRSSDGVGRRLHVVEIRRRITTSVRLRYDVYHDVAHYVCTTSMGVDKSQSVRRSISTSTGQITTVCTTSCRRLVIWRVGYVCLVYSLYIETSLVDCNNIHWMLVSQFT